jgi:hypothetical protein
MKSQEYIKERLRGIVNEFPQISFSYQYDKIENLHIVQVTPIEQYVSNQEYKDAEGDLTFDFDNLFFPESLVFVSDESLIQVDEPEFVIEHIESEFKLSLSESEFTTPVFENDLFKFDAFDGFKEEDYFFGENNYALAA